jgi:hypothetical protein
MAVIKCTLERDGTLKVLEVIKFQPGDTIELDEPLELSWQIEKNSQPLITTYRCLGVRKPFSPEGRIIEHIIPVPCPHG